MALGFVLITQSGAGLGLPDLGHHRGGLLAAHHRDPRPRPHPQHPGRIGPAAHPVVAGPERAAHDHRELGHPGGRDRGDQLGPVLGDPARLVVAADHEAGDVLKEHERDPPLIAELDEVGALERALGEQDPVVGQDAHRVAVDVGKSRDQRRPVELLELLPARAVDDPGDELAGVVGTAQIGRDHAEQRGGVDGRILDGHPLPGQRRLGRQRGHDPADDLERVAVVGGEVVGDARGPGMELPAAEFLGRHLLAGGSLHQRRPTQEDRALVAHDHRLVAHRRDIGAPAVHEPITAAI